MLARQSGDIDDLLDNELWRLETPVLVDIEAIGQLHDATINRPGLVECDCVDRLATGCRAYAKPEMIFANRPLLVDLEISGEHWFGKPGAPGPCFPQHLRKLQIHGISGQIAVGKNRATEIGVRVKPA